jgi:hypothetical protein
MNSGVKVTKRLLGRPLDERFRDMDRSPSMKDEPPCPIDSNSHLYGEGRKTSIDRGNAQRSEVNAGLDHSRTQEPQCQWVGHLGSASDERYNQKTSENRQALKAVRVRSRETLHERRDVGVLGIELIRARLAGQYEIAAQHLHDNEQKEGPRDE